MVIAHWYHITPSMHITIVHCTNRRDILNATIQSHQLLLCSLQPPAPLSPCTRYPCIVLACTVIVDVNMTLPELTLFMEQETMAGLC